MEKCHIQFLRTTYPKFLKGLDLLFTLKNHASGNE